MKTRLLVLASCLLSTAAMAWAAGSVDDARQKDKAKQDPYAVQGSGPHKFDQLKGHEKGYLTLEDVEANSWLAGNFARCDENKDGRLVEKEYEACQPMR